jgi:hypothetical protein
MFNLYVIKEWKLPMLQNLGVFPVAHVLAKHHVFHHCAIKGMEQ